MTTFSRSQYQQIILTLVSSEALGILDSGYVEDEVGVDGALTLFHIVTGERWQVLMSASGDPVETLRGVVPLAGLPDGEYRLHGRVRDVLGNHTILGQVDTPRGDERVLVLGFSIVPGLDLVLRLPGLLVAGVVRLAPEPATLPRLPVASAAAVALSTPAALPFLTPVPAHIWRLDG